MKTQIGKQLLSVILSLTLVFTMMPMIPGAVDRAYADTALSMLYIHNSEGAVTALDSEALLSDVDNLETDGWKWNSTDQQLELNGFEGQYIEAADALTIVLTGENAITMPADGSKYYGIKIGGVLTIKGDGVGERDTLFVGQSEIENLTKAFMGIGGAITDVTITDCDMDVQLKAADFAQSNNRGQRIGIHGYVHVTGNANLTVDIDAGEAARSEGVYKLYAETSGNIDINVSNAHTSETYACTTGLTATGTGAVNLSVDGDGYAAAEGIYVGENAGDIVGKGRLAVGARSGSDLFSNNEYYNMPADRNFTSPNGERQYGIAYNYTTSKYTLVDQNGTVITDWKVMKKDENPLVFLDNSDLDQASVQVGESWNYKEYLHGLVFGGTQPYTYAVTGLPAGVKLTSKFSGDMRAAYINGTMTEVCDAGTAVITVKDAAGATASIEVDYGAVTDAPKYITVDGYTLDVTTDGSGNGWVYTGASKTLTLNNYDGGAIKSEAELNIVLRGNNIVTMDASGSDTYGIRMGGTLTIAGDRTDGDDILYIGQSEITDASKMFIGIGGYSSPVTITDCDLTIEFDGENPALTSRCGIHTEANLTGDATLDVDISAASSASSVGVYKLNSETSGNIDINLSAADPEKLSSDAMCTAKLSVKGTGDVNLNVGGDGYAAKDGLYIGDDAGTVTATGQLSVGDRIMDYFSSSETYNVPADRRICSHDGTSQYGIALAFLDGTGVYTLLDNQGNSVKKWKIIQDDNNPLVFLDYAGLDDLDVNLYDSWRTEDYLHGLVFGGEAPYTFDIQGNPKNITLATKNGIMPYLTGSFTEYSEAGTMIVTVTDAVGSTASIDIAYGETKTEKPVTGMVLDNHELVLQTKDDVTLRPVFTPEDATVQTVRWSSSDSSTVFVDQGQITAMKAGKATITAIAAQGGFSDKCIVYVKENTPKPSVIYGYISNLVPNAEYLINDQSVAADREGCIEIIPEWVGETVTIIKVNDEPKCNSDSCSLLIESGIMTDAVVTLDQEEWTYTGNEIKPAVSVKLGKKLLTENADYVVRYINNKNAGTATVEIDGIGNFIGSAEKTFNIKAASLAAAVVTISETAYEYDGSAKEPAVKSVELDGELLVEDIDYTVAYINNIKAGTATVIIKGKDNYSGMIEKYFNIKLATPKINISNVASSGAIKLSWAAVPGAEEYVIERSVGNDDNYVAYKTTTSTSFTNTATTAGTTYYYRVKAVDAGGESDWAYEYQTCDLARPEISISNEASSGAIKLSWKAVEGADRYEIQRSVGNDDNYVAYKTTTSTSFTNTATTAGTTYYYRVRAIYDGKSSANSAWGYEYQTCDLARPEVTISNVASSGKIKLSWNAVEGADGYEIQRSVGNDDNYVAYKTTTSTSFTNTATTAGTTYYYRVRAIYDGKSSANSAWGTEYQTCDLAAPEITVSGTKNPGKIVVSWSKVSGADRYYIYRATSKTGTYSKYSSTTSTTWTNNDVVKGKTYYYKVKAIYDDNTVANSAYSNMDYAYVR